VTQEVPTTFRIGGDIYQRIRYGEENDDWGADRQPCHDCGVTKASCTFSVVTLSDALDAEAKPFIANALTMTTDRRAARKGLVASI